MKTKLICKNKKAYFDYEIIRTYIAGIMLTGTEIKSIRLGKCSLVDTFCYIKNNDVIIKNSYVAEYQNKGYVTHEERRDRKLLLTKAEINKLRNEVETPGYTIIPLKLFINEKGLCKLEIGLTKGKKQYDKRETLKQKDAKREMDRFIKNF
jgi:SsrA-binding protein